MGKAPKNKRHHHGSNREKKTYLTRTQALNYLQISHSEFRRLCILKGVYPQLPDKKGLQAGKVYFYAKDIHFLNHDPLIQKFRDLKVFIKRLKKAKAKEEKEHEESLMKYVRPHITYDHLIKERYPTFTSALGDLDDCLTLLFMFSKITSQDEIQRREIVNSCHLVKEFLTYVCKTRSLRKVFLSVKGIYYQVSILGQKITFLTPYEFPQQIPPQVDFKIFKSFLFFYDTLMTFVNFKLFHMMGRKYPPIYQDKDATLDNYILEAQDEKKEEKLTKEDEKTVKESEKRLQSLNLKQIVEKEKKQQKNQKVEKVEEVKEEEDEEEVVQEGMEKDETLLFKGLTFYLGREVPRASLEFVIKCFSGKITLNEDDSTITHHIIDRDLINPKKNREYIQPQWVYDCINYSILLPIHKYAPGTKLPPHLSPFVDKEKYTYVPEYEKEIEVLKKVEKLEKEEEESESEDEEEENKKREEIYKKELEAEMQGKKFSVVQKEIQEDKKKEIEDQVLNKKKTKKEMKEEEEKRLRATMLTKRKWKLYDSKKREDKKRDEIAKGLEKKREIIKEKRKKQDDEEKQSKKLKK